MNDLVNDGVVYNKSSKIIFPSEDVVPNDLIHHFIRGYFDGDGSVYGSKRAPAASFNGTKGFLQEVLYHIKQQVQTKTSVVKDHSIWCIKLGGRNVIRSLYDYLYHDATVFLGRKKHKFEDIIF